MKTISQQLGIKEFPFIIKDSKGNRIYYEDSDRYWYKSEYDSKGNRLYFENSNGYIIDKRLKPVKEMTVEQIIKELGYEIKIIK